MAKAKKTKTIKRELSFLIKEYYKIKYLAERLYSQRLRLRDEIIQIMKEKGINRYDNHYFQATLFEAKETRIDVIKVRNTLPPEQVKMFEITNTYPVLKVLPKDEEKIIKEIMRETKNGKILK